MVNSTDFDIDSITLKYFEAGHTFMSADAFHHRVEQLISKNKHVYDFEEYAACVAKAGKAVRMTCNDFQEWENKLSQGKVSKDTRPYLDDVVIARFTRYLFIDMKIKKNDNIIMKMII